MAGHTTVEPGQTAADLRRELALRTAERDEALAQLSATAEVLQVINSSPGDLAPVFDAMLEKAMRLCEAAFGSFAAFDGEFFRAVAHRNVPAELVEAVREPTRLIPGGHFEQMFGGDAVAHIVDLCDTEPYRQGM